MILALLALIPCIQAKANYCPGDDTTLTPSHSTESSWPGWHCRRHAMSYKGDLNNLKSIDFQAIHNANKTILRIHLTNREVSDIPENIFQTLQSLKQLDLHLNATELTSHLFDTLTSLQHLTIYTYQERIPQNLFSHLGNLKYLKLHVRPPNMRLKPHQRECEEPAVDQIITPQLFRPLKQLQYLSITCPCRSIAGSMLRFQTQLQTLILNINASIIPTNVFSGLYDLSTLHIQSRQQHLVLPHRLFYHLRSLQTLYIETRSIHVP
eukprot:387103_1